MHGPRLSGGRRTRRKTVTFDERCDVVEFEPEEHSDEELESFVEDDPDDGSNENDPFFQDPLNPQEGGTDITPDANDEFYEGIGLSDETSHAAPAPELDEESSLTGLVDEIFEANNARTSTPPRSTDLPTDLETLDGVPFGRSHHAERLLQHHQSSRDSSPRQPSERPPNYPFHFNLPTRASPQGPPATPPRRSPGATYSTPPLGRSTHSERVKAAHEEEYIDVAMLPVSPSPHKKPGAPLVMDDLTDNLIPKLDIPASAEPLSSGPDPFASQLTETQPDETQDPGGESDSMDPANLSIGHSEVSLSGLDDIEDNEQDVSYYAFICTSLTDEHACRILVLFLIKVRQNPPLGRIYHIPTLKSYHKGTAATLHHPPSPRRHTLQPRQLSRPPAMRYPGLRQGPRLLGGHHHHSSQSSTRALDQE